MYICIACGVEFDGQKYNANKYCSYKCYHETRWPLEDRKFKRIDGEWYRTQCVDCGKWLKGVYAKQCHSCRWKGKTNPVIISGQAIPHYHKAHWWIKKQKGSPNQCESCGIIHKNPRRFNWANMSGEYLLILSDWKRLCVSCHIKLDRKGATNEG